MDLYSEWRVWRKTGLRDEIGILVGADSSQEWLLEWWWKHYSKHNSYPVAFINFGMMSEEKKAWCRERGELIRLPVADIFVKEKHEIDPLLIQKWEKEYGGDWFWKCRHAWFKVPLALLQSPFKTTIWLDLDCQTRGDVRPLFSYAEHPSGIAVVKDHRPWRAGSFVFITGVIVYQSELPLIQDWANLSFTHNHLYPGNQVLLSEMLRERNIAIAEMPKIYNWGICYGESPEALIYHYWGEKGKRKIRAEIELS